MERKKVVILFSGGLESTALILHYIKNNYLITLLYIGFGYIWEKAEYSHAKKIADFFNLNLDFIDYSSILEVHQLGKVQTVKQNIIPLRNLSLFSFAALYISNKKINNLAIGLQYDPNYPDTSIEYIRDIEKLIRLGLDNKKFTIQIPFYKFTKENIVLKYNLPLKMVFSCTNPIGFERCHECFKCKKLDLIINNHIK